MHSKLHFLVKSLICLKRGDQYVSQFIEVDGGWEIPIVTKVMEAMDHYPNAVFIGEIIYSKTKSKGSLDLKNRDKIIKLPKLSSQLQ